MRFAPIIPLVALFAGASTAQNRPADVHAVRVSQEPRHRPVFENHWVRVLDVRVPAGDTSDYHVHAERQVGVVIAGARTWEQRPGELPSPVDSLADSVGTIFDNATDSLPFTHRVGNADVVPFRYVVAQVLRPWGGAGSELSADMGLRLDREVIGVRVYRVTLAPGQVTARHRHEAPGLTVQVENGLLRWEGRPADAESGPPGAGAWWWRGAGATHVLRNVGTAPITIVEFDWR